MIGNRFLSVPGRWLAAAMIVAVSALYTLQVVGPRVANPFDTSWIHGDTLMHYIGWTFMRHERFAVFPLTFSDALGAPVGTATAFLDDIPLMGLLFKPFRSLLPDEFQYFGIFFFLCSCLQLSFGLLLCRAFTRDRLLIVPGGLMFLLAPPMAWRAFGHFSMAAHWLFLGVLHYFLRPDPGRESMRRYRPLAVFCAVASALHPYLAAMVLGLSWLVLLRVGRDLPRSRAAVIGLGVLCLMVTLGVSELLGFLSVNEYAPEAIGYGYHSMNLLALIDPYRYPSLVLPLQSAGDGQFEGYGYLGLGAIVLFLAAAVRGYAVRGETAAAAPVARFDGVTSGLVIGCFLVFAVSTRVTFGPHTLIDLGVPDWLTLPLATFRASGRFVWPAYYLILLAIVALALRPPAGWWWRSFVAAMVVLQVFDTASLRSSIHDVWSAHHDANSLTHPVWEELPRHETMVSLVPNVMCDQDRSPGGRENVLFALYAARHRIGVDSFVGARFNRTIAERACGVDPLWKSGLRPGTAYVFIPELREEVVALERSGRLGDKHCALTDGFILCSSAWNAAPGVSPDLVPSFPVHRSIPVRGDTRAAGLLAHPGMLDTVPGLLIEGAGGSLVLRAPQDCARGMRVSVDLVPVMRGPAIRQRVDIAVGDRLAGREVVNGRRITTLILVRPEEIAPDGTVTIRFVTPDAASPKLIGMSDDPGAFSVLLAGLGVEME